MTPEIKLIEITHPVLKNRFQVLVNNEPDLTTEDHEEAVERFDAWVDHCKTKKFKEVLMSFDPDFKHSN